MLIIVWGDKALPLATFGLFSVPRDDIYISLKPASRGNDCGHFARVATHKFPRFIRFLRIMLPSRRSNIIAAQEVHCDTSVLGLNVVVQPS